MLFRLPLHRLVDHDYDSLRDIELKFWPRCDDCKKHRVECDEGKRECRSVSTTAPDARLIRYQS